MPYKGYVRKISKYMPNDSYFYLVIQLANFMIISSRDLVRTHNISTQNMSNLCGLVRTQNISNFLGCFTDKIKSKKVNINEIVPEVITSTFVICIILNHKSFTK